MRPFCRAWLDLAGEIPPVDVVRPFLNDREPAKRVRLINSLLAGEEFGDYWGRVLTNWTIERRDRLEDRYDGRVLQDYLRAALEANRPYSAIVYELITGDGGKDRSGPANFLLRYEANPTNLAGAVGRQFLGLSLQCALSVITIRLPSGRKRTFGGWQPASDDCMCWKARPTGRH